MNLKQKGNLANASRLKEFKKIKSIGKEEERWRLLQLCAFYLFLFSISLLCLARFARVGGT